MLRVYTKGACIYCSKAKNLLSIKNIPYKESVLGIHIFQETFTEMFPQQKTMPLIVIEHADGFSEIIGGYDQLVEWLKQQDNPDNGTEFLQG